MAVVETSVNKSHSHHQKISSIPIPTMTNNFTKDLIKFMAEENHRRRRDIPLPAVKVDHHPKDEVEIELSLGLSTNGRFGVDPNAKKIKRTTSEFMIPVKNEDGGSGSGSGGDGEGAGGNLVRTCSLPVESEEGRKKKELQTLRRMEARRRRSERQRNLRAVRERGVVMNERGGSRDRTASLAGRVGGLGLNGGGGGGGGSGENEKDQVVPPSPPKGGGSGGSIGSVTSGSEGQQGVTPMDTETSSKIAGPKGKIRDMPSVSTKGEDGKRIEGLLCKYEKGEEVLILCACHGSFLTPAEFVKHAGGGDVANPLKHINVNSS